MNQGSEKYFGKSWSYFTARETSVFGLDRKALSFKNLKNYYNYSQEDATLDFLTSRRLVYLFTQCCVTRNVLT